MTRSIFSARSRVPTLAASVALVIAATSMPASAGGVIYQPSNPSFGGSPLNGSWLQGQASSQNEFQRRESRQQQLYSAIESAKRAETSKSTELSQGTDLCPPAPEPALLVAGQPDHPRHLWRERQGEWNLLVRRHHDQLQAGRRQRAGRHQRRQQHHVSHGAGRSSDRRRLTALAGAPLQPACCPNPARSGIASTSARPIALFG